MALSAKHQVFVAEYLKDLNATAAAKRAGYSEGNAHVTGSRLTTEHKECMAAIAEAKKARAERMHIDQDYVIKVLVETTERCRQQISPLFDNKGQPLLGKNADGELVPMFKFDSIGALRGAELLGKHLGMFPTKLEHGGPNGQPLPAPVNAIPLQEVRELIKELADAV